MGKIALVSALVLGFSQFSFARSIECTQDNNLVTFDMSTLTDLDMSINGLSSDQSAQLQASSCYFYGIYEEQWNATCFAKSDLTGAHAGEAIFAFYMSGFEHGDLTATDTATLVCVVQ